MGMGRRTEIITEYRQTGRDADGDRDDIVGMGGDGLGTGDGSDGNGDAAGMSTKYFTVSSSGLVL